MQFVNYCTFYQFSNVHVVQIVRFDEIFTSSKCCVTFNIIVISCYNVTTKGAFSSAHVKSIHKVALVVLSLISSINFF